MDVMIHDHVLPQLHERRRRLEEARRRAPAGPDLGRLLAEVDAALARAEDGTFGRCQVCHDPVETDRLLADPLVCLCLDHLSEAEQRALERDLELAARIQRNLGAPAEVAGHGWSLRCHAQPAGPVGGDWCDVFPAAAGDGLIFVLGDVSGKGLGAAMLMTHLHATFRSLAAEGLPVATLVERANRVFRASTPSPSIATVVSGHLHPEGRVELCNAGHWPPLVVRGGETGEVLPTGLPVGAFASARYSSRCLDLGPGDALLLYTDGLIEARDGDHVDYGDRRLERLLSSRTWEAPGVLVEAVRSDLACHLSGIAPQDDLTLLAIRRDD